jgi:hypothetical protein
LKNRFEVSTEGMRELQSGREPWQLAKELVSNSWDEAATVCTVVIESLTGRTAYLSVYDDGPGFQDIEDAWTLMKHTNKRMNPEIRGRFNIGEKEILSVAQSAKVTTSGRIIEFPKSGGRSVRKARGKETKGTLVEVWVSWGKNQVKVAEEKLRELLTPPGVDYTINGTRVDPQTPHLATEATLETVIQHGPGAPIVSTRRKAAVEIFCNNNGHKSKLFEMGIPVQDIECPYSVNVLQKIPLPPNRDTVKDSYLQDIYTLVLNAAADEVQDAAAGWVRAAIEDKDASPEAIKAVIRKRYGDKVVLWSANGRSNDAALAAGYELVNGKTLSAREREVFKGIGIQHASEAFPRSGGDCVKEYYTDDRLTDKMKAVKRYAEQLHKALIGKEVTVRFYCNILDRDAANYISGELNYNIGTLGKAWFEDGCELVGGHYAFDWGVTALNLHEFAHTKGIGHEPAYYRNLEDIAGRAVHLALERPEVFVVPDDRDCPVLVPDPRVLIDKRVRMARKGGL